MPALLPSLPQTSATTGFHITTSTITLQTPHDTSVWGHIASGLDTAWDATGGHVVSWVADHPWETVGIAAGVIVVGGVIILSGGTAAPVLLAGAAA
jgi:hypothetical protein